MDALVGSDARLRIDKSVFQVERHSTRERGTGSEAICGLLRNIKDSKCFLLEIAAAVVSAHSRYKERYGQDGYPDSRDV